MTRDQQLEIFAQRFYRALLPLLPIRIPWDLLPAEKRRAVVAVATVLMEQMEEMLRGAQNDKAAVEGCK